MIDLAAIPNLIGFFGGTIGVISSVYVGIRSLSFQKIQTDLLKENVDKEVQVVINRAFETPDTIDQTGKGVSKVQNRVRSLVTQVNKLEKTQQEMLPRMAILEDRIQRSISTDSTDVHNLLPELQQGLQTIEKLNLSEIMRMLADTHEISQLVINTRQNKEESTAVLTEVNGVLTEVRGIQERISAELGRCNDDVRQLQLQVDAFDESRITQRILRMAGEKLLT